MLNEYFEFINEIYHQMQLKPADAVQRRLKLSNAEWAGQTASLYTSKVFIIGVAWDGTDDKVFGYCNPTGFWYMINDEVCLFKWNQMFGKLADYEFTAYMAHNSELRIQQKLTKVRIELEKYIALVDMTDMYKNPLMDSVERMKRGSTAT